jgi:type I restriction enzyme S subunit
VSLPEDWEIKSLSEVSTAIQYGHTAKASQEEIGPRMLRITDIQDGTVNWGNVPYCAIDEKSKCKYLLKENDLVFARTGATVGKSYLISGTIPESVYASYLIRVRLAESVDPKYIAYFFGSSAESVGEFWLG